MSEARENPGGGVSAKERTGFTKTEKEQLKNEAQRDRYVGDREKRAERRNLLQRLFGSNKQTEKTIAHEEAHQMDRAITQEEAKGVSEKEARRRVYERPQFRLTGEVRSALDEVEAAIEKNSFGPVRERLQRGDMWEGVNPDDVFEINNNHISKLVADHARKLAEEGDGKHFAASVSFLHEYLSPEDFPDDLRPKIHDLVDQELIKKCTRDTGEDFVNFLAVSQQLEIYREPTGETRRELQERTLEWMDENFKQLGEKTQDDGNENDPLDSLLQLSYFMDNFQLLSPEQIQGRPDLVKRVQKAFVDAKFYFEANNDEQTQNDLKDLHRELFNVEWDI